MTHAPRYFLLAPIRLGMDSVVLPGNWGRIIEKYQSPVPNAQTFGNAWIISRELIFEQVRQAHFSDRPSRLRSAFCCLHEDGARLYQAQVDMVRIQVLHEVELVDANAPTHIAPLEMIDTGPPGSLYIEETKRRATVYWTGDGAGNQELVTTSPLRIIRAID